MATKDRALKSPGYGGSPPTGGDRERLAVVRVTLEWISENLPAPDLIKIDVEGSEFAVLEHGGVQLLHYGRPRWIIKIAAENIRSVAQILRSARYRMFEAHAPENEVEWPVWKTLAVPEEKCEARHAVRAGGAVSV